MADSKETEESHEENSSPKSSPLSSPANSNQAEQRRANESSDSDNRETTNSPQTSLDSNAKFSQASNKSDDEEQDEKEPSENSKSDSTNDSSTLNSFKRHAPVLAASRFTNSSWMHAVKSAPPIKPPSLWPTASESSSSSGPETGSSSGASTKIVLQPPKFHNPFRRVTDEYGTSLEKSETEEKATSSTSEPKQNDKPNPAVDSAPKFLPLGVSSSNDTNNSSSTNNSTINNTVGTCSSASGFVFGQNLKDRVAVASDAEGESSKENEGEASAAAAAACSASANENGSSELLFSNVTASASRGTSRPGLTLTQAAQELEEANRANKRKYNEVTPLTGEEDETNVLQINCKLFAFDKKTSNWQERGRGTLRLNDRDDESRLVGRTAGTQRLVLNTKIWSGMTAERAGPKSLRLTAMDVNGDIRIFIVQANPKEVDQLHSLLLQRLERQPKKAAVEQ